MARRYSFVSRWRIPAPPDRCWAEFDRFLRDGGSAWWPGVRVQRRAAASVLPIRVGDELDLMVRSPLGYRLRTRLVVTAIVPEERIAAGSGGDLRGSGSALLHADGVGTRVEIRWDVETIRRWMNVSAPLLRPVFVAAHAWVMARGERGLRRAVRSRRGSHAQRLAGRGGSRPPCAQ